MSETDPTISFQAGPDGALPPDATYTEENGGVCPMRLERTGRRVTVLRSRAAVVAALSDPRFSTRAPIDSATAATAYRSPQDLQCIDRPAITRLRRPLSASLSERNLERRGPEITHIAQAHASAFAAGNQQDLIAGYCEPFVAEAVTTSVGVPREDWPKIKQLSDETLGLLTGDEDEPHKVRASWDRLYKYTAKVIAAKETNPDGSVVEGMIKSLKSGELDEDEILHTTAAMMIGFPSPLPILSICAVEILQRPDVIQTCLNEPALWGKAVDELLRYKAHFPFTAVRIAKEDVELKDGTIITKGEVVLPSLTAAAYDPEKVAEPEKFDIHQDASRSIVFAAGPHFCPGTAMSRQWLGIGLKELFTTLPNLSLGVSVEDIEWEEGLLPLPKAIPVR